MKKIVLIICILISLVIGIKYIPFGIKESRMGATLITLEVPKLSSLSYEDGDYTAHFKTLRGKETIKKELESIINQYQKLECEGDTFYYNLKEDVSIIDYEIESSLIMTKYSITYKLGYPCED